MTHIDIVFAKTADPNPDFRFVEVEDASGASAEVGDWLLREDGYWVLRVERGATDAPADPDVLTWLEIEVTAISCRYHGDPSYDHDAYWMKDEAIKLIAEARKVFYPTKDKP